jgi:hypothetical protein
MAFSNCNRDAKQDLTEKLHTIMVNNIKGLRRSSIDIQQASQTFFFLVFGDALSGDSVCVFSVVFGDYPHGRLFFSCKRVASIDIQQQASQTFFFSFLETPFRVTRFCVFFLLFLETTLTGDSFFP